MQEIRYLAFSRHLWVIPAVCGDLDHSEVCHSSMKCVTLRACSLACSSSRACCFSFSSMRLKDMPVEDRDETALDRVDALQKGRLRRPVIIF